VKGGTARVRGAGPVQAGYVYARADGIHVNIRLEEHKLCMLVMIGVRADGRKELIALANGYREPAESCSQAIRGDPQRSRSRCQA
jgi:transposase-like protein